MILHYISMTLCLIAAVNASLFSLTPEALSNSILDHIEAILNPINFQIFKEYCKEMPAYQLKKLIDHVPKHQLSRILTRRVVQNIAHWELVTADDVIDGRLSFLSLSSLNIDSFNPDVLLEILKSKHFLARSRGDFCNNPKLKDFVQSDSWRKEPRLMALLDSECFTKALSSSPSWAPQFIQFYSDLVDPDGYISPTNLPTHGAYLSRWILRTDQFIEILLLERSHPHKRMLDNIIASRSAVLKSLSNCSNGALHCDLLSVPIGHRLSVSLNGYMLETQKLENILRFVRFRKSQELGTSHSRSTGALTKKSDTAIRAYDERYSDKLKKFKRLEKHFFPSDSRKTPDGKRSKQSSPKESSSASPNAIPSEKLFDYFIELNPLQPCQSSNSSNSSQQQAELHHQPSRKYWLRQFLLHSLGPTLKDNKIQLINELFASDFLLRDEEARQWISRILQVANFSMLDICVSHSDSVHIYEFLKSEFEMIEEQRREQFFKHCQNGMIKIYSSLLIYPAQTEDELFREFNMSDFGFYFDHYPDVAKLQDRSHETTDLFFRSSIELLKVYSKPFALPLFSIEYNKQSGVDAQAIMTEWLQYMLEIMASSDRGFFIKQESLSDGVHYLLPNLFVDPQIMFIMGILLGKCIQKGISSPVALHDAFWKFLMNEKTSDTIEEKILECQPLWVHYTSSVPSPCSPTEFAAKCYPQELTVTDYDQLHNNFLLGGQQENTFVPKTEEEVSSYLTRWKEFQVECLWNGKESFRRGFGFFVNLEWMKQEDSAWIAASLQNTLPINPKQLIERIEFTDSEAVSVLDVSTKKYIAFHSAFTQCVLRLTPLELKKLLQFWTGSSQLPSGGYSLLALSVKCRVIPGMPQLQNTYITSFSCHKRMFCPAYPTTDIMYNMLVTSITGGYASGFYDDPVDI